MNRRHKRRREWTLVTLDKLQILGKSPLSVLRYHVEKPNPKKVLNKYQTHKHTTCVYCIHIVCVCVCIYKLNWNRYSWVNQHKIKPISLFCAVSFLAYKAGCRENSNYGPQWTYSKSLSNKWINRSLALGSEAAPVFKRNVNQLLGY